jgi:hypothetical protein
MSDDKTEGMVSKFKDAAGAAASASAAAAQALVVDPGWSKPELVAAMVLAAFFPPIIAAMTEAGVRRMKTRADHFYRSMIESWASDENVTPEEIAGRLEANREDPDVADAIWRAVRGLMEAPNDAAAVTLGVLTAEYMREKRKADVFFRGTVRLLSELSESEIAEAREILSWVLDSTRRDRVLIKAYNKMMGNGKVVPCPWRLIIDPDEPGTSDVAYSQHPSDGDRLLTLLTANGLARDPRGSYFDYSPVEAEVERSVVERLVRILRGAAK